MKTSPGEQDGLWIPQVKLSMIWLDVLRDGGREEQRVWRSSGRASRMRVTSSEETHREHLAGLVEHCDLGVIELQRAAADVPV